MITGMYTILVLFALVVADRPSPNWDEVLFLSLPELAEHYEAPIRIDPRMRDSESGVARDIPPDERRRRIGTLQAHDLEPVVFREFVNCKYYYSLPPDMRQDDPEMEARCGAMELTGTSFLFADPVRVEDRWSVEVYLAGDDFVGDALVVIERSDGEWRLAEFTRMAIINYF